MLKTAASRSSPERQRHHAGTLFPDLLYFDLRGSITQQPVFGGFGAVGTGTLPPNEQETLSQVSATPLLQSRLRWRRHAAGRRRIYLFLDRSTEGPEPGAAAATRQ
ncbi:MAG: hypothetical protein WDN04_06540 [Rhodospirillales bacterium]